MGQFQLSDDGNKGSYHLNGVPVASHRRGSRQILTHFFPDDACCTELKV